MILIDLSGLIYVFNYYFIWKYFDGQPSHYSLLKLCWKVDVVLHVHLVGGEVVEGDDEVTAHATT